MKLIIAGSRTLQPSYSFIMNCIQMFSITEIDEVVSGTARGVDQEGEHWASHAGVKVRRFPADWETHGKSAGYLRNAEMAKYADALLLIWDGESSGSRHMLDLMKKQKKPIYQVVLLND